MLETIRTTISRSSIPLTVAFPDLPDTPVLLANACFRELIGRRDDEILGRNCRFLQGPLTTPQQRAVFRESIASFAACRGLITNYAADGRVFLNYVLMFPLVDRITGERAILGSQFDITPQHGRDISTHAQTLAELLANLAADAQSRALFSSLDAISRTVGRLVQARLDVTHLDTIIDATQSARWRDTAVPVTPPRLASGARSGTTGA